jgi:hypothetical protein
MTQTKREALREIEEDKLDSSIPVAKGTIIQETLQFNDKALEILIRGLKLFAISNANLDILYQFLSF